MKMDVYLDIQINICISITYICIWGYLDIFEKKKIK